MSTGHVPLGQPNNQEPGTLPGYISPETARMASYYKIDVPLHQKLRATATKSLERHGIDCNSEKLLWFSSRPKSGNVKTAYIWVPAKLETWTPEEHVTFLKTIHTQTRGSTNPTRWSRRSNIQLRRMIKEKKVVPQQYTGQSVDYEPPESLSMLEDNFNIDESDRDEDSGEEAEEGVASSAASILQDTPDDAVSMQPQSEKPQISYDSATDADIESGVDIELANKIQLLKTYTPPPPVPSENPRYGLVGSLPYQHQYQSRKEDQSHNQASQACSQNRKRH